MGMAIQRTSILDVQTTQAALCGAFAGSGAVLASLGAAGSGVWGGALLAASGVTALLLWRRSAASAAPEAPKDDESLRELCRELESLVARDITALDEEIGRTQALLSDAARKNSSSASRSRITR